MYWHTTSGLRGPITRTRNWWMHSASRSQTAAKPRRPRAEPAEEIREALVARVRREIAEGCYETPEKWEAALERLVARLEQW